MNNFFKCPPAFPPNFPLQRLDRFGFGFASVIGSQPLNINEITTVLLPKEGPLNKVVFTGAGLTILEPGVYEVSYMVTVSFEQDFAAIDGEEILTLKFLGRLLSTPGSGGPGTPVDGSQSRITDIFEVETESKPQYADTLGSSVLIKVPEPTTISINVENQTTITGTPGQVIVNPGTVESASLFVEQIA